MEIALVSAFKKLAPELSQISEDDRIKAELPEILKPEDYYNFLSDHMRFDLSYNPGEELEKVKVPVLILAGEFDTQVLIAHNIPLMEAALKKAGNTKNYHKYIFKNESSFSNL